MKLSFTRIDCEHRQLGQRETAVEVFFVLPNGERCLIGQLCKGCASAGIDHRKFRTDEPFHLALGEFLSQLETKNFPR